MSAGGLLACNGLADQALCIIGIEPVADADPFARLQILVVFEEMLDLLQGDIRQVGEIVHLVVTFGQMR